MALDYQKALAMKSEGVESAYTDKDVMLYALGVGMGRDPMDLNELHYTYEKDLKTLVDPDKPKKART